MTNDVSFVMSSRLCASTFHSNNFQFLRSRSRSRVEVGSGQWTLDQTGGGDVTYYVHTVNPAGDHYSDSRLRFSIF